MSARENFGDNRIRLARQDNDIREYERNNGADDFSAVVHGALHAEHTSNTATLGSGYPCRYSR
ncbi:hypothetical protein ACWD5V_10005 [Streptomyces sp. NPDC002523]